MAQQNTATAFWVRAPGSGELRTTVLGDPGEGEVLVKALFSAISRGTESLVFRGGVPESLHQSMRCPFQEGSFPGPVKYGYMSVGVVEAGAGPEAAALIGRTVFCLHPHQDRYLVPAGSVVLLPSGVPPERAVLAANLETAVNGVWDGAPGVGDRVVVVGAGVVGLLAAWLCSRIPGVELTVVDPAPARAPIAEELGLQLSSDVPSAIDADLVFHASGTPEGLRSALRAAGQEATVVELSWFGDRMVPLPLGENFHPRRILLRSSQVGHIPPSRSPRWDHRRRMGLALRLLRDPVLDHLITGESAFAALPAVMERLSKHGEDTLCHRIRYP
jgi:threonine dehydrogenase-like Zn-dependent dehydrogenase